MFIKLSIGLFLLRIAVGQVYIWILRISMVVITIWTTAIFFYDLFSCLPVQAQWDVNIENQHCVSGSAFVSAAYSFSVMAILSDWLYALMPISMIWSVQMSLEKKISIGIILSLGVLASVATLIRIKYLIDLASLKDILYTGTNAFFWSTVEPGVAITAASLITIRPLLRAMHFPGVESDRSYDPDTGGQRSFSLGDNISSHDLY